MFPLLTGSVANSLIVTRRAWLNFSSYWNILQGHCVVWNHLPFRYWLIYKQIDKRWMDKASCWNNWILISLIFFLQVLLSEQFLLSAIVAVGAWMFDPLLSVGAFHGIVQRRALDVCPEGDPVGKTIKLTTCSPCCLLCSQAAAHDSICSICRDCKK